MLVSILVTSLAQQKWQASGLTNEQAAKLGLRELTHDETQALGPSFQDVVSLWIPYHDDLGEATSFFRVRYLGELKGFAAQQEKPQRYAQAYGTVNEVYLPPLLSSPWRHVLLDPKLPLVITEGELKAAAACSVGIPTIGLGGVDVWRSARRGLAMLPTLEAAAWAGRRVVICFDSDAATKPGVVRAALALALALGERGALPHLARLPSGAGGAKQGMDDLLVASGADALRAVVEAASPIAGVAELWRFNTKLVYVKDIGAVVEQDTGRAMDPGAFVAHAYCNHHFDKPVVRPNGNVSHKRVKTAQEWLEWPQRFELEGLCFEPGKPRVYRDKLNGWQGWPFEPKDGDVAPFLWLMDVLFKSDIASREWVTQWAAKLVQEPGIKLNQSVVIWGRHQGTGKTLLSYCLKALFGEYGVEIGTAQLRSEFNGWAVNKQFICGDEVTGGESRSQNDKLKQIITQHTVTINQKFVKTYTVRDCANYIFTSNHPDAFFLEDDDRRLFVHEVVGPAADDAGYARFDRWYHSTEGMQALFAYLLAIDTSAFNPRGKAPVTAAKQAMIEDGRSDVGAFVAELRENPAAVLGRAFTPRVAAEAALFTTTQLLKAYDPDDRKRVTANGLGRELKRQGFNQVRSGQTVRVQGQVHRLFAVRDCERWQQAPTGDIAQHYQEYFQQKGEKF